MAAADLISSNTSVGPENPSFCELPRMDGFFVELFSTVCKTALSLPNGARLLEEYDWLAQSAIHVVVGGNGPFKVIGIIWRNSMKHVSPMQMTKAEAADS